MAATLHPPWRVRLASHLGQQQHRNAYYLMLNGITGAAAGLLFWLLLARVLAVPPHAIGVGAAVVSLGTILGVIAKGGLDTALIRHVPSTSKTGSRRLLRIAVAVSVLVAVTLAAVTASFAYAAQGLTALSILDWILVAAIAATLAIAWLQDAHFLAEGDAKRSFQRNLVLCGARLLLPVPIVLLAWPQPVALSWAIAIAASALAAIGFSRTIKPRAGPDPDRRAFLATAGRNVTGSAAEFIPGLLLAPLVLAASGAEAAAAFSIAWTAASLLFLASAAVCRSALAELVRAGPSGQAAVLRRAVLLQVAVIGPGAVLGMALAPYVMAIFGPHYALHASAAFAVLCASAIAVAPTYLYLSLLRARDRTAALVVFPIAMTIALLLLAPIMSGTLGVVGVALAWLLANIPFGLFAAWRLRVALDQGAIPGFGALVAEHETEVSSLA